MAVRVTVTSSSGTPRLDREVRAIRATRARGPDYGGGAGRDKPFLKAVATLERDFQLKLVAKQPDGTLLDFAGVKKLVSSTRGRTCDSGHPSLKAVADLVVWFEGPRIT